VRDDSPVRELWGTFSVRDHTESRPFVAEVMLYDRLVIPVPPPGARDFWAAPEQGWNPDRQERVLKVLRAKRDDEPPLVHEVEWNDIRRSVYKENKITAASAGQRQMDGFQLTADQLIEDAEVLEARNRDGEGARVVSAYVSRKNLAEEVDVTEVAESDLADPLAREEKLAIAVGRSFLVPDDPSDPSDPSEERDLDLLERAVRLARKQSFRQQRAAYNDWVEQMVHNRLTTKTAVDKMARLLEEYQAAVRREKIETRVEQAFLVVGTGVTVGGHFFPPLWIAGVLLAPARYAFRDKFQGPEPPKAAAMFHEARNELKLGR
jgi:hypothetical protein